MKNCISIVAVAALMLAAPAFAAATFDGGPTGTGTDWNTAENWDTDVVPTIATGNTAVNNKTVNVDANAPAFQGLLSVTGTSVVTINADWGHISTETNKDVTFNATITQNAGDVYFSDDTRPSGGGTYNMNGGTFENRDYWRFDSAGTINITGGSFSIGIIGTDWQGLNMNNNESTLKVVGDAATISLGHLNGFGSGTLDIVFKDGGITTIDVTDDAAVLGASLPGTLNVSVDSGSFVGDYTIISAGSALGAWSGTENLPAGWSVATVGNDLIVTAVPEPATMSLLAIGGLALLRRRKRA
jgi:hypothetical protein